MTDKKTDNTENLLSSRLERELKTIDAMLKIYCRHHHEIPPTGLCASCTEFRRYARTRLSRCPYQDRKPTCANCPIHCYQKNMQQKAKEIMRFAGPRMLWCHPVLTFYHLLDGRRITPDRVTGIQTKAKLQK